MNKVIVFVRKNCKENLSHQVDLDRMGVKYMIVDVNEDVLIANRRNVNKTPTTIVVNDNGVEIWRCVGKLVDKSRQLLIKSLK